MRANDRLGVSGIGLKGQMCPSAPAIVFQAGSGVWLVKAAGFGFGETWLLWTYGLFLLAGACWLPVVWLQLRIRDLAGAAAEAATPLPERYHRLMVVWFRLGWPAFLAVVVIFYLMVAIPWAGTKQWTFKG